MKRHSIVSLLCVLSQLIAYCLGQYLPMGSALAVGGGFANHPGGVIGGYNQPLLHSPANHYPGCSTICPFNHGYGSLIECSLGFDGTAIPGYYDELMLRGRGYGGGYAGALGLGYSGGYGGGYGGALGLGYSGGYGGALGLGYSGGNVGALGLGYSGGNGGALGLGYSGGNGGALGLGYSGGYGGALGLGYSGGYGGALGYGGGYGGAYGEGYAGTHGGGAYGAGYALAGQNYPNLLTSPRNYYADKMLQAKYMQGMFGIAGAGGLSNAGYHNMAGLGSSVLPVAPSVLPYAHPISHSNENTNTNVNINKINRHETNNLGRLLGVGYN